MKILDGKKMNGLNEHMSQIFGEDTLYCKKMCVTEKKEMEFW